MKPTLCSLAFTLLIASAVPALALETVMQDDFAQASGTPISPAKWTVNTANIFKVNAGPTWSFFQGITSANAPAADAEVMGFSGKDVVVEFDLNRFVANSNYFDLVLRQNVAGNTRVRFAANAPNNKITVAIMQPGSPTVAISLGETSFTLGQYDWATLRVRINDSRVQVLARQIWNPEFTLLGEYAPATPTYINAGAGTVRIEMPQSAASNYVNLDTFKVRQADAGKKVFADFHGYRYTRENDGQLGNWKQALQSPQAPFHIANYNADLMDANGVHQLSAPGNPAVGMQSYNDDDYIEYHVLTAKMAGIDGFIHEYGLPGAGLTDSDLQKMQAIGATYNFQLGIDWLDGLYYPNIGYNSDYQAWCTANGKNPALDATKTEYIPQVFQKLIDWIYDKPNAAKVGGKPLMLLFNGSPLTASDLGVLKTKTYTYGGASNVPSPFLIPRRAPMGLAGSDPNVQKFYGDYSGWETQADGTFGWKPMTERTITSTIYKSQGDERDSKEFARAHVAGMLKTTNDKVNLAGVMPAFDNQFNASWGEYAVELLDRKNGLTYTESWEQYLRDRDVIDAVLIPTWSDHTEGSGIEPMSPYGDREVRATAKYSAQFKGLPDTSASLDFTLPKELFDLRKLVTFLEASGCPSAALAADRASLDAAGLDIAAASYTAAAAKLTTMRARLDDRRTHGIATTTYNSQYFTGTPVIISNGTNQNLDIPTATADLVRSKYFDGIITFEYLDDSTFAANKDLFLFANPAPANTGKPGEWRVAQMQLRHGNGDGQWKTARVALNKKNLPLTSGGIDLYFSALGGASNGGTIRNVTVALTTYEYTGEIWWTGPGNDLNTGTNWLEGVVPASTGATLATRQDALWNGSAEGNLNLTFGAAFGGSFGVGLVLTAGQTSALTITNSDVASQNLRMVNSTSGTVGGIQIASGAGVFTLGAPGAANPIQMVLGQGTTALNYYLANNSSNTATIEENVTILKGGTHAATVVFNAGTWEVKGVVAALSGSSTTGGMTVSDGRVILRGANTFTQALNVNGGILEFRADNNLGAGTSSIRLGQTTTSGTLRFTGNSDATISRLIRIGNGATTGWTGSATIENTGSGVLTFNNPTFNEVGTTAAGVNRTLTLSGTHTGNNTISGVIANNNPGLVSLVKNGPGKWILSGTNTYTGDTMVNDGTLLVNNTSGSATGAGNITVQSGARLGGTGSISGNVTVPVGGGFVFALATSAAAHDRLDVGPVTLSGASSVLITASAAPGTGTYTLLRSTSALSGTLPSLTLPGGFIGALTFNGTDLQLTLSAVPFANWATQHGLTGADALATADPDFDGLQNLIEYAVGTSPSSSTSTPWMITTASGYLTLSIIKSTAASGVTWSAQSSPDLVTWQSSDTTTLTNDATTFSARDNFPVTTQPRFLRLKITTP